MDDQKDPPIIEREYITGVKVVDIGDLRVARGKSRRPRTTCKHNRLVYDENERRIWCKDCESDVEPFDAFIGLVENFFYKESDLRSRQAKLEELENYNIRRIAAKNLEAVWNKKRVLPACPHCRRGLMPDDFRDGAILKTGKQFELAKREKERK